MVVGQIALVEIFEGLAGCGINKYALMDAGFLRLLLELFVVLANFEIIGFVVIAYAATAELTEAGVPAFFLELLHLGFCGLLGLAGPAIRIQAVGFRFVLEKVCLACAALAALEAGFVFERCA